MPNQFSLLREFRFCGMSTGAVLCGISGWHSSLCNEPSPVPSASRGVAREIVSTLEEILRGTWRLRMGSRQMSRRRALLRAPFQMRDASSTRSPEAAPSFFRDPAVPRMGSTQHPWRIRGAALPAPHSKSSEPFSGGGILGLLSNPASHGFSPCRTMCFSGHFCQDWSNKT